MAHHEPNTESGQASPAPAVGLRGRLGAAMHWCFATRLRTIVASAVGLTALATMFAVWSILAHAAVESLTPVTIADAHVALDEGRYEEARAIVGDLQNEQATPELLTGALFVLGAAKAHEAAGETTSERRQAEFQVAARYLREAVERDLPPLRARQALFLLGKSLVEGGDSSDGIEVLERALRDPQQPASEIRKLLVAALLEGLQPRLEEAFRHNEQVLLDPTLSTLDRDEALVRHADLLIRLQRRDEARQSVDKISPHSELQAGRQFLQARLLYEDAVASAADSPQRETALRTAIKGFQETQRTDGSRGELSRQAMLWTARCYEALGETDAAVDEYARLAQNFGDHPEAIVAALSLADSWLAQDAGDRAMDEYRLVLETIDGPDAYRNSQLPLAELQQRLSAAHRTMLDKGMFSQAMELVEQLPAALSYEDCLDRRAATQLRWGEATLADAESQTASQALQARRRGRAHFRAAGQAYEEVARVKFATRDYGDALWAAADAYFRGQSYSHAERMLEQFLAAESRRWNASALVRLGQCRLALGKYPEAIATLEECVELFPRDAMVSQSRLECARAMQQLGQFDQAQVLLQQNLQGDALTPQSQEWRDSLFALGRLLYDAGKYDDAIAALEEAVQRYPDASGTLLARYTIARAFHGAAESPAARLKQAKTENERQKNRKQLLEYLEGALAAYIDVQRTITLQGRTNGDLLSRELLLNCYMMKGSVLYQLRRWEEARQAYGSVVTLYENQPIVLESLIQVANCWRRLNQPAKARVTLQRAKLALSRMPPDANYLATTNFDRQRWQDIIEQMSKW